MTMAGWYADANFSVHADMKSHTGGVLTMGEGAIQTISTNQNLNKKISMEE